MINVNYGSKDRNTAYTTNFSSEYKIIQYLLDDDSPVCFDIGAHHGETIKDLREYFKTPIIYAFEPDPINYNILNKSVHGMSNVYIVNKGIGSAIGQYPFYSNQLSHTNSFLKVNETSKDHIRLQKMTAHERKDLFTKEYNREILLDMTTLDAYCNENNIQHIDFLKIDAQGFEIECLKGCSSMLSKVKILKCELSFFDFYEKSNTFYDLENLIKLYNFSLYSIPFVSQNPQNGRTDWVEVIYINNSYG